MVSTMPMGFIDRAWLRMDSAQNPMVITAVLGFEQDGGLPFSTFVDVVVARLALQARFRRRPRSRRRGDVWVELPGFDARAHVERVDGVGADDEAPAPPRRAGRRGAVHGKGVVSVLEPAGAEG